MLENDNAKNMKMYIFVKDSVPDNFVPVCVAHASLSVHLKFSQSNPSYLDWLNNSFKKVVCGVSENNFNQLKGLYDYVVLTESNLDNNETVIAFRPFKSDPNIFKMFKLWKPKTIFDDVEDIYTNCYECEEKMISGAACTKCNNSWQGANIDD